MCAEHDTQIRSACVLKRQVLRMLFNHQSQNAHQCGRLFGSHAQPVQLKLAGSKPIEAPKKMSVASAFSNNSDEDDDDDDEPPPMKYSRNIGRLVHKCNRCPRHRTHHLTHSAGRRQRRVGRTRSARRSKDSAIRRKSSKGDSRNTKTESPNQAIIMSLQTHVFAESIVE